MYSSYHMLTFAFPPFGPKHHSHCIAYCCGHVWLGPFNGATSLSILFEHISVLFCLRLCDNLKCTNARTHTALERSVWLCLGYTVSHRMYILWFHEIEALSWLSDWFYWRRLCVICMILIIAGSDLDARISKIHVWSIDWCYVNVKMIMSVRIN